MNTGLIIQRTYNGLEIEYTSIPNVNLESLLHDERKDALQISNRKVFYSISINKGNKIYSLIKSVRDREKREGFAAIHLLTSNTSNINNVVEVLNKIAAKYEAYFESKEHRQDYSEILSNVKPEKVRDTMAVSSKLQSNVYFAEAADEKQINELLNNDKVIAVKKLYVFSKDSGYDPAIAQSHFIFKPFVDLDGLKTIDIPDSHLLEYIKVDGEEIKAGSGKILVSNNETISYKRFDEKKERTYNGVFDVQPKYVAPKRERERSENKRSLVPIIAVATTCLLLGGLGGYFFPKLFPNNEEATTSEPIITSDPTSLFKLDKDTKNPVFVVESGDNSSLFDRKIKFDTDKKEWKIKESAQTDYQSLDRKTFKDLLGANTDSAAYIKALEQISGYELKSKPSAQKFDEEQKEEKSTVQKKTSEPSITTVKPVKQSAESVKHVEKTELTKKQEVTTTKANNPSTKKEGTTEKSKPAPAKATQPKNEAVKKIEVKI